MMEQNISVLDIVEGMQAKMRERIGHGGLCTELDGHTIIMEGDSQAIIIDLKDLSLQDLNSRDLGFRAVIDPVL